MEHRLSSRPPIYQGTPLTEQQPVAVLDLYAEEPVLGPDDTRFVREARVFFGRPTMAHAADDDLPEPLRCRLDFDRLKYTVLWLSFDLQDLPRRRRYTQATVRMTFDDPTVRSVRLDSEPDPHVELVTWGEGREELTWQLTARDDGMRPGGRKVSTILESPLIAQQLTGVLDARVEFARQVLGKAKITVARSMQPLRFTLDIDRGDFQFPAE
jgi:hypothetical protein